MGKDGQSQQRFLWGAQYYRGPTPERECWARDLRRMRELGFTSVKNAVQWRWVHRQPDKFFFDDIDELMDLAQDNGLAVHLNLYCETAPTWLYRMYPDAKMMTSDHGAVEPHAMQGRPIGGYPGPCLSHPGALEQRRRFLTATVERYRGHPALAAWDVWNEPTLVGTLRWPIDLSQLVCYNPHSIRAFLLFLQRKYGSLERLNEVWGRCYGSWDEVEAPRNGSTFTDFIDWREFFISVMSDEGRWRLRLARQLDPAHAVYLHVVANLLHCWNSITACSDEWELLEESDFAASSHSDPAYRAQHIHAGGGRIAYNTEVHINGGNTAWHQRLIGDQDLRELLIPQIGAGFRGFQFWQFAPETLGIESPCWGIVNLDGSDRPATKAIAGFWRAIAPHAEAIASAPPPTTEVGIWKSRKNEIFSYCMNGNLADLFESVEQWWKLFHQRSIPYRVVTDGCLAKGRLKGLRLLVMPMPYYLTEEEAGQLDAWVKDGGVLISEAHLGAYDGSAGRHSRSVPGCGLALKWGIRESESTRSDFLPLRPEERLREERADEAREPGIAYATPAVKRALSAAGENLQNQGRFFPLTLADGGKIWGCHRFASLAAPGGKTEATFHESTPLIVSKQVGKGLVIYCGTNVGLGSLVDDRGMQQLADQALAAAQVRPVLGAQAQAHDVHVDLIRGADAEFLAITNRATQARDLSLQTDGTWEGICTGQRFTWIPGQAQKIPARFHDLLRRMA